MNNLNRQHGDEAVYPGHDQWATSTETGKADSVELSSGRRQEIIDALVDAITNSQLDLSHKITPEPAHIAERYPTYYHVVDDGSESPKSPDTDTPDTPDVPTPPKSLDTPDTPDAPDAPNGASPKSEPGEFGGLEPQNVPSPQMNTRDPGFGDSDTLASQNTNDSANGQNVIPGFGDSDTLASQNTNDSANGQNVIPGFEGRNTVF